MTQQDQAPKQVEVNEDYFTLREFLAAYKLSYFSYNRFRKAGKGPPLVVLGPRNLRVSKASAAKWFASLEQKTPAPAPSSSQSTAPA